MVRVRAPVRMEYPSPRTFPKNTIPNKPNIIDGMPDRVSVVNSISRTTFPGFAYSFRYTAEPMPRGVAMSRVMITMYSVFIIFPRIPKVPFVALEAVLKNAHVTCGIPRTNTYPMMPARRRMEKPAQVYMITVRNTSRPRTRLPYILSCTTESL